MSTICMNPFTLKEENGGHQVPCGKCYNCKRRRASTWSVRLMKEYERSTSGYFITLTYDSRYVPITKKGFMSLDKKHLQTFFKRLRQWHGKKHTSIKYYAVGEYGGKTYRPHYHIIIFNANIEFIEKSWSECVNKKLALHRPLGEIHYGTLTEASVGYTLKYISKAKRIPLHANDDRLPEFSLMSKGLGSNYLISHKIDCVDVTIFRSKKGNWYLRKWITHTYEIKSKIVKWHKDNCENRIYIPLKDGIKAPMPRYFKQKIYDELEKENIVFHWKKKIDFLKEQEFKEHGDNLQSFKEQQYLNGKRKLNKTESLKI